MPAMKEIPSCMSEMPGPDELVMTRVPVAAAPSTMLMLANSLSACRNVAPTLRQSPR